MATGWTQQQVLNLALKATPSCLFNNLTSDGKSVAYIHGSEVLVYSEQNFERPIHSTTGQVSSKDGRLGQSIKYVPGGESGYLVLASIGGIQIFNSADLKMVLYHPLDETKKDPKKSFFARGVSSAVVGEHSYILVGTSYGDIITLEAGKSVSFRASRVAHSSPVTVIATSSSDQTRFATADDSGNILVWNAVDFTFGKISGNGDPCTGLGFHTDSIIASFGSGKIKIFSAKSLRISMEIAAHGAYINGLDIHPSGKFCATVSDDSFINVWSLPHDGQFKVNCIFSSSVKDRLLTGVQFCGPEKKYLAALAYDTDAITVWKQ